MARETAYKLWILSILGICSDWINLLVSVLLFVDVTD